METEKGRNMDCEELRNLLDPFLDRELPANEMATVELHLEDCPDCHRELEDLNSLRNALQVLPGVPVPPGLRDTVIGALGRSRNHGTSHPNWRWIRPVLTHVAAALFGALAFFGTNFLPLSRDPGIDDILSAHLRSLRDGPLTQVAAGDSHIVKPWFTGKIDYAPRVIDLAEQGFPMIGGRVDEMAAQDIAALVYGRNDHRINLFILLNRDSPDTAPSLMTRDGFNIIEWREQGFRYLAVSDLSGKDLMNFAELLIPAL
jgi:anti-sigma factor (TIGR02949 family)